MYIPIRLDVPRCHTFVPNARARARAASGFTPVLSATTIDPERSFGRMVSNSNARCSGVQGLSWQYRSIEGRRLMSRGRTSSLLPFRKSHLAFNREGIAHPESLPRGTLQESSPLALFAAFWYCGKSIEWSRPRAVRSRPIRLCAEDRQEET